MATRRKNTPKLYDTWASENAERMREEALAAAEEEPISDTPVLPTLPSTEESDGREVPSFSELAFRSLATLPSPLQPLVGSAGVMSTPAGQATAELARSNVLSGMADRDLVTRELGDQRAQEARLRAESVQSMLGYNVNLDNLGYLPPEISVSKQKELLEREQNRRAEAEASAQRSQSLQDTIGGRWNPINVGIRAVGTTAGQPEMVLPTATGIVGGALGGPAGATAGAVVGSGPLVSRAYNASYSEARQLGFETEEAQDYATLMAAVEFAPSVVGGVGSAALSGAMRRFGIKDLAKDEVEKAVRRRVGLRVAATMGLEGLDEVAAEGLGHEVRKRIATSEDFASEDALTNLGISVAEDAAEGWTRYVDPFAAGTVGGGVVGGGSATYVASAQAGRDAAITERETLRAATDRMRRAEEERTSLEAMLREPDPDAIPVDTSQDVSPERQAEEDAAWEIRQNERAREDNWNNQRTSIERRVDTARENVEFLQERVDDGDTSTSTLNSLTEALREQRNAEASLESHMTRDPSQRTSDMSPRTRSAEDIAAEQESQRQAEADSAREAEENAERERRAAEVAKRRQAAAKKQASQSRKDRQAQARLRNEVMDEVIAEFPEATDAEIGDIVEQRLSDPNFETEREVAQVRRRQEAAARAQQTRQRREAQRAAIRNNPNLSDREIAAQLNANRAEGEAETTVADVQAARQPQPQQHTTPIPENAPKQQKINALAEDMGINLGMAPSSVEASTPSYAGTYLDKTRKFIRGLVDMDTAGSVATQNLLRQGKLIILPNPQAANMPASNNVAEFSPETGEMFIYTDYMDDNPNAAKEIVKAVHESGHYLQLGTREGRSATLSSIFGDDGHNLIRQAAQSGDARAQRAVARAVELFPDNQRVQNLEIPAYFFNEVMEGGDTLKGRLRNFVPNVVGRTRNLVRDRLGVDLNITPNDIAASVDAILEEAVDTPIQPAQEESSLDNLGMVVGERYARFNEASERVPAYRGAVDNLVRTEISDALADVADTETLAEINNFRRENGGEVETILSDVFPHMELLEGYPGMETMPVIFRDLPGMYGYYSVARTSNDMGGPSRESMTLDSTLLHNATLIPEAPSLIPDFKGMNNREALRSVLLHETQHAVQAREGFVDGASADNFMRRSIVNRRNRERAKVQDMINSLDLRRAEESLPLSMSGLWQNEKRAAGLITPEAEARLFLEQGYAQDSNDRLIRAFGDRYKRASEDLAMAQLDYDQEYMRAFDIYQRDYGETEARNTEYRANMTPEELASSPAESTMVDAPGSVPVERTLDSAQYTGGIRRPPESAASPNLGMVDRGTRQLDAKVRELENNARGRELTLFERRRIEDLRRQSTKLKWDNVADWRSNAPVPTSFDDSPTANAAVANQPYDGTYPLTPGTVVVITNRNSPGGRTVARVTAVANANPDRSSPPAYVYGLSFERDGITRTRQNVPSSQVKEVVADTSDVINLGMAGPEAKDAQPDSNRVQPVPKSVWLRALFDPSIGTGREAQAIVENAAAAPADTMLIAEKYAAEYDDALGTLAVERGMSSSELNTEITNKLDAISDREDSYDANLEAFHDVTKDYGKAGEALNKLRDTADRLSIEMVEQRAQQAREGRPLTESEKERYATIINNLGRYAHRMYAAGMGKQGKKWGKSVWNDWKKGGNAHNYHLVENAVKHLVDNDLYIPSAEEMVGVKTDTLSRLVQTWGLGNPEAMSKSDMQDALLNARDIINGDSNRLDAMAQSIVQELLGLKDQNSPITNYYRGGKINDAILRERKNIPAPLRELLGEITHPAGRLMVTAGKQAEFIARNKMLMELREASETDPTMQRHIRPPDTVGTPESEGMTPLQGDSYGPLEGFLVSPNMRALLGDTIQQLATFEQAAAMAAQRPQVLTDNVVSDFLGKYGTVAKTEKAVKIIGNPINFLYNFAGAPDMLLRNGNLDPRIAVKAINTAAKVIAATRNPRNASEEARRIQRAGVTDSAFIGEINKAQWRELEGIIREMEGKPPLEAWNWLRSRGAALTETYAMMDVWSKIANFYHQADAVLPAFYKAEGIEKTQEQIDREAADIANRTNITYKRAAPVIKAIERAGITQFGTYFYETFRVEVTNALQGIDELRRANAASTPEGKAIMRNQAIKRIGGQLTSWGLKYGVGRYLTEALFGDDEEERRDIRSLFPDYLQNQDFVPMGFTDMAVGNRTMRVPVFMNASRIDPTGPSSDIMRTMLHEEVSPEKVWSDIVDLYIAPRILGQTADALQATFGDKRITRRPLSEQLDTPGYSFVSNTFGANNARAWTNVVESFLPGIATAYRDTNEIPDVEDSASALAFAMTKAGATMYILDPSRASDRVSYEYSNTITQLRREVADYIDTNEGSLSEDELLSKLTSMQSRERDAYDEVARVYRGAIGAGLRPREISIILKNSGVPDDVINQARRDRFESRFISKASIDRYAQNEMNKGNKSRQEKREIKRKWDDAWRMLDRQRRNLRRNDG